MSKHTQPQTRGPYSIASASIGARLNLDAQRGDEHAKLLWFVILSHTPWSGSRPTWATDTTLANEAGLTEKRDAERALARLRAVEMITTPLGHRPGARRPHGRLLVPRLAAPVKVLIPTRGQMTNLWLTCAEARKRPAALVTLVVGLHALACHAADRRPGSWAKIPGTLADVRRFVGARKGHAWTTRVRDLEQLGILSRVDGLQLAPVSSWNQTARAMASVRPLVVEDRWGLAGCSCP